MESSNRRTFLSVAALTARQFYWSVNCTLIKLNRTLLSYTRTIYFHQLLFKSLCELLPYVLGSLQVSVALGLLLLCAFAVITIISDQDHILCQLLRDGAMQLCRRLGRSRLFFKFDLVADDAGERADNVLGMQPLARTLHRYPVGIFASLKKARDIRTCIILGVEHRDPGILFPGHSEREFAILPGRLELSFQIRHKVARHEVRHDHVPLYHLGVLGHFGFRVEMFDSGQFAVGQFGDVWQRGPHEVFHP